MHISWSFSVDELSCAVTNVFMMTYARCVILEFFFTEDLFLNYLMVLFLVSYCAGLLVFLYLPTKTRLFIVFKF